MNMKRLIVILLALFWTFTSFAATTTTNKCWDTKNLDSVSLSQMMDDCKPEWVMEAKSTKWSWIIKFSSNDGYTIDHAKWKIYSITLKAVILATILAIWWLVYAWILFNTSYWDDAKNKKAKEAVKYSLIWLLVALLAQQGTNAVVNFIYWVSG